MSLELARLLSATKEISFVYLTPEIPDFTLKDSPAELVICPQNQSTIKVSLKVDNLPLLSSLLQYSIFEKTRKVLCWNIKPLFSYFLHHTQKPLKAEAAVIDLKLIESYLGMNEKQPVSLAEALLRMRGAISSGWNQPIYKKLHLPLMMSVIPAIETTGLINSVHQSVVYPYYEIDGQDGGRLCCHKAYMHSFNPHSIGPEERVVLKPRSQQDFFMYFDYRQMEVAVLAWLSKDEKLNEILSKNVDFYLEVYELVTGQKPDENSRNIAKKFFLPVIYGQSPKALSERLGLSLTTAETIVKRISQVFFKAWKYVEEYHQKAVLDHVVKDHYGRVRRFDDKEWKARGFSVQSPAAAICLDRLIRLHRHLSNNALAYHVHDGYVVLANKANFKQRFLQVCKILEDENDFAPGLRLRVTCKAGRNINDLKPIQRKEAQ